MTICAFLCLQTSPDSFLRIKKLMIFTGFFDAYLQEIYWNANDIFWRKLLLQSFYVFGFHENLGYSYINISSYRSLPYVHRIYKHHKTGEWKPMNFKLILGWSSKPPQKGTCIANPVYSLTEKLCLPNPWIIKSNLDTESDGEQKSLSTEISTVDRTTLRSLLSCTFKNPSRCCFWMAWKTPLDLSSIGALQFSARNIQNSVWTPFLLHVEKSSCCPLWKNYLVTTNWEVQWFCFKYPKIRLNSSNFSDFPKSSSRISIRQQTSSA